MKFKIGDLVVGTNKNKYGVTTKGNGYGKVIQTKGIGTNAASAIDEYDICVLWLEKGQHQFETAEEYWVEGKYFKLKEKRWRDEL